jgi:DNA primase
MESASVGEALASLELCRKELASSEARAAALLADIDQHKLEINTIKDQHLESSKEIEEMHRRHCTHLEAEIQRTQEQISSKSELVAALQTQLEDQKQLNQQLQEAQARRAETPPTEESDGEVAPDFGDSAAPEQEHPITCDDEHPQQVEYQSQDIIDDAEDHISAPSSPPEVRARVVPPIEVVSGYHRLDPLEKKFKYHGNSRVEAVRKQRALFAYLRGIFRGDNDSNTSIMIDDCEVILIES